jgi:hypothetical protein
MMNQPSFFRLATKQFWLLFGGIWFLVGSVFAVVGAGLVLSQWRYHTDGVTVQAKVAEKSTRTGSKGKRTCHVTYEFTTQDQFHVTGNDQLPCDVWAGLNEGEEVRVQYLAARPEENRITEGSDIWLPFVFTGIGTVFGGIGGFLVVRSLNRVRTVLRLFREGIPVQGTVTAVAQSNVNINRVPQWVIKYTYTDHVGQKREGESDYMSPADADAWHEGDTGAVRFDQAHPEISFWVGRE